MWINVKTLVHQRDGHYANLSDLALSYIGGLLVVPDATTAFLDIDSPSPRFPPSASRWLGAVAFSPSRRPFLLIGASAES
jgi:hypothetical protein